MQKVMTYVAYAAGVVFILLGLAILFTKLFPFNEQVAPLKIMFGVVLILYGAFRIVSTRFNIKRQKDADAE